MEYFSILNLNQEPFSNSPDPEYFFRSKQHVECLQKLELSLRMRRGLNVVIGDVGTGKTTLCRQLIRNFADDQDYETHLILDPQFSSPTEFLRAVAEMFIGTLPTEVDDEWQTKEQIKKYLFRKGVDENKVVILIIDEGQKIPLFCLEILREFLNYETNEYKLLQIAIFAQKEFEGTLKEHANFSDRITLYHELGPMSFRDTRLMIQFRLNQASRGTKAPSFFSYLALWAIFQATKGYPRKIINLCHRCLLTMIIQNRNKAGWFLVRSSVQRAFSRPSTASTRWGLVLASALLGLALIAFTVGLAPQGLKRLLPWKPAELKTATVQIKSPPLTLAKVQKPVSPAKAGQPDDQDLQKIVDKPEARSATAEPEVESATAEPEVEPATAEPEDSEPQAIVETAAEASTETPVVENRLPSALGYVALRQNETLWRLVEKVYGIFDNQYLKSLLVANPGINNPDKVAIGQSISLPAIPTQVNPLQIKVWWVKLAEKDRLDAAINILRTYPEEAPPIRIIPYWNSRLGLRFAVLLKEYFFDETSAQNQLRQLPSELNPQGTILPEWDKDTVFYADPFLRYPVS